MCKKPSTLWSVLSAAKIRDEAHSSLKGLCVISGDFVTTEGAGNAGTAESRFSGTVYAACKDPDNCTVERHSAV